MKDVINIVNLLLKDLDGDNSLGSLIYAVCDLVSLNESNKNTSKEASMSYPRQKSKIKNILKTLDRLCLKMCIAQQLNLGIK